MRTALRRCGALVLAALAACAPELPPASETDVMRALALEYVLPLGRYLVVSAPSDCRTDGVTRAALPAELFEAYLGANASEAGTFDLRLASPRLRVDDSGAPPWRTAAREREPVLLVSRAGIAGSLALVCIEVYGVEERAFFLLMERDPRGDWSVRTELEAWREAAPLSPDRPPEELPDGTIWDGGEG